MLSVILTTLYVFGEGVGDVSVVIITLYTLTVKLRRDYALHFTAPTPPPPEKMESVVSSAR